MADEKLKCLTCGNDLSYEFTEHVIDKEPLICPKCGTKHKIYVVNDRCVLLPFGWGSRLSNH